jgi:hypothetical protein
MPTHDNRQRFAAPSNASVPSLSPPPSPWSMLLSPLLPWLAATVTWACPCTTSPTRTVCPFICACSPCASPCGCGPSTARYFPLTSHGCAFAWPRPPLLLSCHTTYQDPCCWVCGGGHWSCWVTDRGGSDQRLRGPLGAGESVDEVSRSRATLPAPASSIVTSQDRGLDALSQLAPHP